MAVLKTPVTEPSMIQSALNLSGYKDYAVIMRPDIYGPKSDKIINKWARHKPVDRNVLHRIDDENKRANKASSGIYWGLQVGAADWSKIHSATWDYVDKPNGDINVSPFRPWDFVSFDGTTGYDPNAEPTLKGICGQLTNGECYYQSGSPFEVQLDWDNENSTTGVDVFQCHNQTSGNVDLRDWYLCIAIDGYARAMINYDAGKVVSPITNGTKRYERFTCPILPTSNPNFQQTGSHKVSFFLADLDSDNAKASAVKTTWTSVTGLSMGSYAISVPEIVGYTIDFILGHYGKWSNGSMAQFGSNINVRFVCTEAPTEVTTYEIDFSMGTTGGSKSKSFTLSAGSTLVPMQTFEPTSVPVIGRTYTCEAKLSAIQGNNKVFITSYKQDITWTGESNN
jgi:hypothetical protein